MNIQYNWYELNTLSKLPEAHVTLIFALYVGRHKPLSANLSLLQSKLVLPSVPVSLFQKKVLTNYSTGIFTNYETIEPQCYIRNCSFVHMRFSARTKADYIYILSQRSISNENNWIPDYYIDPYYYTNPLITKIKNKITFPLENNYGKRLDTTEKTTSTRKL
jgi:hypothetical protein